MWKNSSHKGIPLVSYTWFVSVTIFSSACFLTFNIFIYSPAYFGILDLSGEDIEVKNLFTDDEWNEMIEDFKSNVNLSDLEPGQDEPFYKLMDKITEVSEFVVLSFN